MPKVVCAEIDCKHNVDNSCTASRISLSDGYVYTMYQGDKHIWECKTYEMSDEAKDFYKELKYFEVC